MTRRALISGITGQDGSYLAELLLAKGYEVHGLIRRSSSFSTGRIEHLYQDPHEQGVRLFLHYSDLSDASSLITTLNRVRPDEVYNLGAQSHVKVSFEMPEFTADSTAMGTLRLLEAVRHVDHEVRFYQAGSSEMFGAVAERPQRESTQFRPRSPYAVSKVFAHQMTVQYREAYGLFATNGILFNHESPRRGATFVTRKVTRAVAAITAGTMDTLYLGNLDARRDWGYAPEYVEAMWRMLQHGQPDDFVVATGEMHSVREFVELAFSLVGRDWNDHVVIDPRYFRPTEVDELCGDASKARHELGWASTTSFVDLVRIMLEADLREAGMDPAAVIRDGSMRGVAG
jgi:GDPmannose 4,6-dehydratase